MLRHDSVRDYAAVGPQRLADAYELLEQPTWENSADDAGHRHLRAAVYLAGYAVECALKAYIVSREFPGDRSGRRTLSETIVRRTQRGDAPQLSGRRTHNLTLLLRASHLERAMEHNERIKRQWGMLLKWDPDWRYNPRPYTDRSAARTLVDAAAALHDWISSRRTATKEDSDGGNEL
ncbi:MAG TPA: hypothetical protein DGT21_04660 [Armatimonadetes bacterium]|nr:hypothetical protein [Armatimonadota bacterium]